MAYANVLTVGLGKLNPLQVYVLSSSGNRYRWNNECHNPTDARSRLMAIKKRGKIDVRHWTKLSSKSKPAPKTSNIFQKIHAVYSGKAIAAAPTAIQTITSIYSGE